MNVSRCILLFIAVFIQLSCRSEEGKNKLADGTYIGSSQAEYVYEPFVGTATIKVENNKIVKVDFQIADTLANEIFDARYEKHFTNNAVYTLQCRNDWKGVRDYPAKLLKKQDIKLVDAVSGATWSHNIFKASVEIALKSKPSQ
jgi:major membrane immunogen (membrane-anchored lipoprotein)